MQLHELTAEMDRFVSEKGWYDADSPRPQTPRNLAASLAIEAAEVLEGELALFQRRVTLGEWDAVRAYLAGLPQPEGKAAFVQLIASLVEGPERKSGSFAQFAEKNYFDNEDLVGLISCAPDDFAKAQLKGLGTLLRLTVSEGCLIDTCLDSLRSALDEESFTLKRDQLAHILLEGAFPVAEPVVVAFLQRVHADRYTLDSGVHQGADARIG